MKFRKMVGSHWWVVVVAFTMVGCKKRSVEPPPAAFAFPPPPPAASERTEPARRPAARRLVEIDAAAPVNTLNGDPKGLKREELRAALEAAMPSFAACLQSSSGAATVGLTFDAQPDGSAQNVRISGVQAADERCIATALTRLRLPPFEGKPVPVEFPLTLYHPAAVAAAPDAALTVAPAAPVQQPPPSVTVMAPSAAPVPPAGTSTAPYTRPVLPATAGSNTTDNQGKLFIKP